MLESFKLNLFMNQHPSVSCFKRKCGMMNKIIMKSDDFRWSLFMQKLLSVYNTCSKGWKLFESFYVWDILIITAWGIFLRKLNLKTQKLKLEWCLVAALMICKRQRVEKRKLHSFLYWRNDKQTIFPLPFWFAFAHTLWQIWRECG